ncbi:uncharacterized protein LOC141528332 [Cotesia typhae]|uniref:uncharacterized protein LOC141528332 n=1 Tax=Cotesia typhae TaxID=2053667 RepID=UPI003D6848A5
MQRLIVYLVLIVLVLSYVIDGLKIDNRKKVVRNNANRIALRTKVNFTRNHIVRPVFKFSTTIAPKAIFSTVKRGELTATNKLPITDLELADAEARDRPKKKGKHKMNRAVMALLLAYKLKFAALIPSIIMGLFLLLGTTGLAGFFFALFAAILGLKGQ